MNVLEKILEEIKQYTKDVYECDLDDIVEYQRRNREDECTYIVQGIEEATEFIRSHMDEAKDANAPSNDGWIPVEERLPEETTGKYYPEMIVTTSYGAVTWGFYRVMDKQWYIYSNIHNELVKAGDKEIVAWQPLPEPYKPKKDV